MRRTVKIFCGGTVIYGKEVVSLLLARGLRDAGWDARFITSRWNGENVTAWLAASGFESEFLWLGFISATLRLEPLRCTYGQMVRWPQLMTGFRAAAGRTQVIVHTNWQHALLLLPLLDRRRDVFWLHEMVPDRPRFALVFRAIADRVGRIVCVSHAVARTVRRLGIADAKIVVIHNAAALAGATPLDGRMPRLRLGIVGQVGAWKGHDDVIAALGLLAADGIRPTLHIFGSGAPDYVDALKRRIHALGLDGQVIWHGVVLDQIKIFSDIDVCLVPSRFEEPLGMSAIEANTLGRPVICTARGGLPEIVADGVNGFLVGDQNPDQLAQAIKAFIERPQLLATMGEAGRQRMRDEFSLDRLVAQFVDVFEKVGSSR